MPFPVSWTPLIKIFNLLVSVPCVVSTLIKRWYQADTSVSIVSETQTVSAPPDLLKNLKSSVPLK